MDNNTSAIKEYIWMHIKQKLHQSIKLLDNRFKSTDKCETK